MSTETSERIRGYISKIIFNNGQSLDISQNDIVLFVGPNNAGKSQALKDIFVLSQEKMTSVVISEIETAKTEGSLSTLLDTIAVCTEYPGYFIYSMFETNATFYQYMESDFVNSPYFGDFRDFFIANIDTTARLTICVPPNNINRTEPKRHPIHYAAFNSECRKWLSESFKRAFGVELIPNTQHGSTIPLCIGDPVKLPDKFVDEQQRLEAYADILETYKQVQDQGDGIKSFTGILLYLMLNYYCTYLIDEPESFLHPPQAHIMGQIIGASLTENQQAFISTHSDEVIKGLLEVCPDRIKIVRITREDDTNYFSVLNNEQFREIWSDPLLKYSNIMSSLFHKTVVLCESDSDCKLYSIIEGYLKNKEGRYSETLYIHCGGKQRMPKIAKALRALQINIKLIPDIDVMNDESIFREIVEAFGIAWNTVQSDYKVIVSNLHSSKEHISRADIKNLAENILNNTSGEYLFEKEIKCIRDAITPVSKWRNIKKSGVNAIPSGEPTQAFKRLDKLLREKNVFMVPVGELESFIKEVGGHGPEWVNVVLERYPGLDDPVYESIKNFIKDINL